MRMSKTLAVAAASCLATVSCTSGPQAAPPPLGRIAGARTPLTAACDPQDTTHCSLPFPSNTFAAADAGSLETGIRVRVTEAAHPSEGDDTSFLNTHDGFSRASPLVTGVSGAVDGSFARGQGVQIAADAPIRLYNAQPGHPDFGRQIDLWAETVTDASGSLVLAYPMALLDESCDYVAVVTDDLRLVDGGPVERERASEVGLGLVEPSGLEEQQRAAYHAPTRALLEHVNLDAEDVVRAWDFTTRSAQDPKWRLEEMLDGVVAGMEGVEVQWEEDGLDLQDGDSVALVASGWLTGVPNFLSDDGRFSFGPDGDLEQNGVTSVPFRILVPAVGIDGERGGPLRVGMYGHGFGGDVSDRSMDATFAAFGVMKVGLEFGAWNGPDLPFTLANLTRMHSGVEAVTAQVLQSIAGGYAVYRALDGVLGDALTADILGGQPNPAAGRSLWTDQPLWGGGSLGGTAGLVIATTWPEVEFAALNVPGAVWTHFVGDSYTYDWAVGALIEPVYGGPVAARRAIALSQGGWDDAESAGWVDRARELGLPLLLQESVGDPVLPNVATEFLARSLGAPHVGAPITELHAIESVEAVGAGPGLTQFRVPDTGVYDVHGFAGRDTPAGAAAMEQIFAFALSCWDGEPRIVPPSLCAEATPEGACDFVDGW